MTNDKACPGVFLPARSHHVGICIGCERFQKPGAQIEPMAKRMSGGVWFCPERKPA